MSRKIRSRSSPSGARIKSQSSVSVTNFDNEPPIFSLRFLEDDLNSFEQSKQASFALSLFKRGKLAWKDLKTTHRHGLGSEKIPRSAIRKGIPSIITEDVTFLVFRCSGLAPMIGYRDDATFHIIWLDFDFKCYNHD